MNASNPIENIISHETLKINRGRFGVMDRCRASIEMRAIRKYATYFILYPFEANMLHHRSDIAPAGPPPMNPTHELLGENRSPI